MHHPYLDLEFRDSPENCLILIVPHKILNIVKALSPRNSGGRPSDASRGIDNIGWSLRDGPTTPLCALGKNEPFFSFFLVKHRIIFTKFRDTPNPKVKRCELRYVKEASLSNDYRRHHTLHSHQKVQVWGWVKKKKGSQYFLVKLKEFNFCFPK